MKKPHEQEWKVSEDEPREVEAVDGCYTVCTVYGTVESRDERAAFIAAAPTMARMLLKVLKEHGASMPHTAVEIEDELRKAGVLP